MTKPIKTGAALDRLAALMPNEELRLATESTWELLGTAADRVVAAQTQRDAALEALRPFARIGKLLAEAGFHPVKVVIFAEDVGGDEDFAADFFLTALKTWKEYRGEEEP